VLHPQIVLLLSLPVKGVVTVEVTMVETTVVIKPHRLALVATMVETKLPLMPLQVAKMPEQ
jgi:hypothetical protein